MTFTTRGEAMNDARFGNSNVLDIETLDRSDWESKRLLGCLLINDLLQLLSSVRDRRAYTAVTRELLAGLEQSSAPSEPSALEDLYHRSF